MPLSQIPTKKELMESFGYLSFHCALMNLDVIGIRLRSGKIILITYRGQCKTGFMYEGEGLTQQDAFDIFSDVPADYNNLDKYERDFGHQIEVLYLSKDHYVWINENEISKIVKTKK